MGLLDRIRDFFGRKEEIDLSNASGGITAEIVSDYNKSRPKGPQKVACYAPFKSIYFGHHGRLLVCCYNRNYVLGVYPEQSIKEIWFGESADNLRKSLTEYDFSNGCKGCLAQLIGKNFDATKAMQYDEQKSNRNGYPSVMEFELDNTCNLECAMCNGDFSSLIRANREKRAPLESPYDDTFIEQLKEFIPHLEEVKFYGGEPFLIETYYKIWELIMNLNPKVRISVQTNATILNNRVKNILNKTNFHLNISLDSLEKETYESIRVNAKFERVMENIEWFISYCKEKNTFIGISACAMRNNWKELPKMVTFCNDRDIPVYFHTVFYPLDMAIRDMDFEDLIVIKDEYSSHLLDLPENTPITKKNKKHFGDVINQIENWLIINKNKIPLNSFYDFKHFLEKKFSEAYFKKKFPPKRAKQILTKITELKTEIPDNFFFEGAFSRIDISNDIVIEEFLCNIEKSSKEDLKEQALAFHNS